MSKATIGELLSHEKPLLLPAAHDALSARLIERAGFLAYAIGGFALTGVRYGLPDIGITSFGEIYSGVADIIRASNLPVLVDADTGYGDVKSVTRTVRMFESLGVAGILLEDQASPKRCGHMTGKSVLSMECAASKLEAALAARQSSDFFLIARTDARAVFGLDEAIRRAQHFISLGADAVFIEAPESVEELEIIGRSIDAPILANMAQLGRTPILPPKKLRDLGFSIALYPSTLLIRVILAIQGGLESIIAGEGKLPADSLTFSDLTEIFDLAEWAAIDDQFGNEQREEQVPHV